MLLQRSKLDAQGVSRPRLISPWLIAFLSALLLFFLALLYPYKTLVSRVATSAWGDPLTTSYLRNLLRTDADNVVLRIVLARQQLAAKQFNAARATLVPLFTTHDSNTQTDVLWLYWQISEREFLDLPKTSAQRPLLLDSLKTKLCDLERYQWDEPMRVELAKKALAYDERRMAARLFEGLAGADKARNAQFYVDAAQIFLGDGEYRLAAQLYLKARDSATETAKRREYFLAAIHTLQSGNMNNEALVMAERELKEFRDDREVLLLLIDLARAAGRLDLADKYVRSLLRLSLLKQWRKAVAMAAFEGKFIHTASDAVSPESVKPGPDLPFDDRVYTIGYEVFLGNKKLEDAYRVAAAAVRQVPNNIEWRKRLARVAEWTGRPLIALEHWLVVAQKNGDTEAWSAVLRLSPGLLNDDALLLALRNKWAANPRDPKLIQEVVAVYERLGKPREALAFMEKIGGAQPSSTQLEMMAALAQRMGDDSKAIALWQTVIQKHGVTVPRASQLAALLLIGDRAKDAFAILEKAKSLASDNDLVFWRIYAGVAERLQENQAAANAYEKIVNGDATTFDYDALIALLRDDFPLEAAAVAEKAWRKFDKPSFLLSGLGLLAVQGRWQEMARLFAEINTVQLASLESNADFVRLRAQHYQGLGNLKAAIQDLNTALALQPQSTFVRQTLVWLMINTNDVVNLRALLARYESAWSANPEFHDTLAAAHLALSEPHIALRYLSLHVNTHRGDFLWLMNFADALDQNGETDRAWRLREQLLQNRAWRNRQTNSPVEDRELAEARRIARIRLGMSQRPGDSSLALLRELLRNDLPDGSGRLSPAVREIVLSWWQNAGEFEAERGYLWQQYAANTARPLWAEITAGLTTHDTATVGELLDRYGERLPRYDRVNSARHVNDAALAATYAYETQSKQPEDNETHQQLREIMLSEAHVAGFAATLRSVGPLRERPATFQLESLLWPRVRVRMNAGQIDRHSRDESIIRNLPANETLAEATLRLQQRDGETQFGLGRHRSVDRYNSIELQQRQALDRRASLTMKIAHGIVAPQSAFTKVAGKRDQFMLGLDYQISRYDRVIAQASSDHYFTQNGKALGKGKERNIEYVHELRNELRDLQLSMFFSNFAFSQKSQSFGDTSLQRYIDLLPLPPGQQDQATVDASLAGLLPANFRMYGLRFSTNMRLQTDYTRSWRPFASAGLLRNNVTGAGYQFLIGVAGSVFGNDHLQVGQHFEKGGNATLDRSREFGFSYRMYY